MELIDGYIERLRRALARRGRADEETIAELRAHLEQLVAAEAGDVPRAIERFGEPEVVARSFPRRYPVAALAGLAAASLAGVAIGWVDSGPRWDDTGVTVGAILLAAGALGLVLPRRPWRFALALGVWIPVLNVVRGGSWGSAVALAFALAGCYAGSALRRGLAA